MDRDQHVVQDAGEHYAVFLMQLEAERLGRAIETSSNRLEEAFLEYLKDGGVSHSSFEGGKYKQYKDNADLQLPHFVERLTLRFPRHRFGFHNVEKEYRNLGMKADFLITSSELESPIAVSLKNYLGPSGILRPQVAAGTFLSFTLSFLFERVGVGTYRRPDSGSESFRGSDIDGRDHAMAAIGKEDLIPLIHDLDQLQAAMREEFLGPECEMYDKDRVASAARRIGEDCVELHRRCP